MAIYITSDLHVMHYGIVGPDSFLRTRKHFKDVVEFEAHIIKTFNNKVKDNDTVIIAGDIAMNAQPKYIFDFLSKLNGQIILIKGNHDSSRDLNYIKKNNFTIDRNRPKFVIHDVGFILKHNKKVYHITHYPMDMGSYKSNLRNLCGHIHDRVAPFPSSLNIGIDSPEVRHSRPFGEPVLIDEAAELLEKKLQVFMETQFTHNRENPNQLKLDI